MVALLPRSGHVTIDAQAEHVDLTDAQTARALLEDTDYVVCVPSEPIGSGHALDSLNAFLAAKDSVAVRAQGVATTSSVPVPTDPHVIGSLLTQLARQDDDLSPRTAGVWFEARAIVSEWLAGALESLDRDECRAVIDELATREDIDWTLVRRPASAIAFLYNFLPYTDTGATVGSKRIRQFGDTFDVVTVRQDDRKKVDPTIGRIALPYIDDITYLDMRPSWAGLNDVAGYAIQATRAANRHLEAGKQYSYMYSRAMWLASHFAAATFKAEHPELHWIAEFSDPVALDVEGDPREGEKPDGAFYEGLLAPIREKYPQIDAHTATVFGLCELVAFAGADVLLFTNEYQRDTMLSRIEDPALRERAASIAKVSNHPTLPEQFYRSDVIDYSVDPNKINLAYFGEFYSNRGLREVTDAIRELPDEERRLFHLHVFTNYAGVDGKKSRPSGMPQAAYEELTKRAVDGVGIEGLEDQVHFHASLPYLQFLGVTSRFDYLLVTDTRSGPNHDVNPYLPSKWSDYSGSTAKTWALVEPGSILSGKPAEAITPMGDTDAISQMLARMVAEHGAGARDSATSEAIREAAAPKSGTTADGEPTTSVKIGKPREGLPYAQEDLDVPDDLGKAVRQQRLRWNRSVNQIRQNLHALLAPRSRGTLFPVSDRRVLEVVSQPDEWSLAYSPAIALSRVSIEEPYIDGSHLVGTRQLRYNRSHEAPEHQAQAAARISGLARDLRARAIVTDHSLVAASASLMAARRLGLPLIVNVTRHEVLEKVLALPVTEVVTRPVPHVLLEIIREADGVLATDPDAVTYLRSKGMQVGEALTDNFLDAVDAARESQFQRAERRTSLRISYAGTGAMRNAFAQFGPLADLRSIDETLGQFPDLVILDLLGADSARLDTDPAPQDQVDEDLQYLLSTLDVGSYGHESLEDGLRELGRTGARVVVLLPENAEGSPKLRNLVRGAHLAVAGTLDSFTRVLPTAGANTQSVIFANGMSRIGDSGEDVTSWDRFARALANQESSQPPVNSGSYWSSDRVVSMSPALRRAARSGDVTGDAWWAGLEELAAGHTAIDMVVHLVRAAGIAIDHPRSLPGSDDPRQDAYFRATGKLNIRASEEPERI